MNDVSTASDGGGLAVIGRGGCFEPRLGSLVEVTQDHDLVVEFDGPEHETLRRPALTTVKIDRRAVGHAVELMFVQGDLDRPVITKVTSLFDWQAEIHARWVALGRKVLGPESRPRKLADDVQEFAMLVCVAAWFETHGNITHAAASLRMSRRTFREHLGVWKAQNPRLVPSRPLDKPRSGKRYERRVKVVRPKVHRPKVEAHVVEGAPSTDQGEHQGST